MDCRERLANSGCSLIAPRVDEYLAAGSVVKLSRRFLSSRDCHVDFS